MISLALVVSAVVAFAQTPAVPPAPPKARAPRPARAFALPVAVPNAPLMSDEARAELETAAAALAVMPPLPPEALMELAQPLEAVAPALAQAEAVLAELPAMLDRAGLNYDDDDFQGKDAGDSLYREARRYLNRNRYAEAITRFREFRQKYPNSESMADALYFEAFALYRGGDVNQLREARARLDEQMTKFPRTGKGGDARSLKIRILQSLAERGDEGASAELHRLADDSTNNETRASAGSRSARSAEARALASAERGMRSRGGSSSTCDGNDDDDMRLLALNALMQMDSEQALPILKSVLAKRDSSSVCLRARAVFIASQKRSPETSSLLLDAARNDPSSEVRAQAVQWLGQIRSPEAIPALDSILRTTKDVELQEKAVFALSQMRDERAGAVLRRYAERADVPVAIRERTIFWLGQQRSDSNNIFLRNLYARLQNEELKERVLFALSQKREQGNDKWLLDLAANDREPIEVRKRALFYAGQSGAPTADLTALYDRTKDREMKEQLIFVYSQRRDTQAVDKLLDIAKKETDPELRKKAIFWLSQSRDPRVAQFLLDLINQP